MCVSMSILCVLNVNRYCKYPVAFLVSFMHYECRHEKKGNSLVLVPIKCDVHK